MITILNGLKFPMLDLQDEQADTNDTAYLGERTEYYILTT